MQLAPDWDRDAFTRGNFCPRGQILESRRDPPQDTRVVVGVTIRPRSTPQGLLVSTRGRWTKPYQESTLSDCTEP
jgi:hypothetical protein